MVSCFIWGITETSAREAVSVARRDCSREVREGPGYKGVFCWEKNPHVFKHQKITTDYKKQTPRVNDFSSFLCMGRFKSLGPLTPFLRRAPQPPGTGCRAHVLLLFCLHPTSPSGAGPDPCFLEQRPHSLRLLCLTFPAVALALSLPPPLRRAHLLP